MIPLCLDEGVGIDRLVAAGPRTARPRLGRRQGDRALRDRRRLRGPALLHRRRRPPTARSSTPWARVAGRAWREPGAGRARLAASPAGRHRAAGRRRVDPADRRGRGVAWTSSSPTTRCRRWRPPPPRWDWQGISDEAEMEAIRARIPEWHSLTNLLGWNGVVLGLILEFIGLHLLARGRGVLRVSRAFLAAAVRRRRGGHAGGQPQGVAQRPRRPHVYLPVPPVPHGRRRGSWRPRSPRRRPAPPRAAEGDQVRVLYDPADPRDIRIDDVTGHGVTTGRWLVGVGAGLLVAAFGTVVSAAF